MLSNSTLASFKPKRSAQLAKTLWLGWGIQCATIALGLSPTINARGRTERNVYANHHAPKRLTAAKFKAPGGIGEGSGFYAAPTLFLNEQITSNTYAMLQFRPTFTLFSETVTALIGATHFADNKNFAITLFAGVDAKVSPSSWKWGTNCWGAKSMVGIRAVGQAWALTGRFDFLTIPFMNLKPLGGQYFKPRLEDTGMSLIGSLRFFNMLVDCGVSQHLQWTPEQSLFPKSTWVHVSVRMDQLINFAKPEFGVDFCTKGFEELGSTELNWMRVKITLDLYSFFAKASHLEQKRDAIKHKALWNHPIPVENILTSFVSGPTTPEANFYREECKNPFARIPRGFYKAACTFAKRSSGQGLFAGNPGLEAVLFVPIALAHTFDTTLPQIALHPEGWDALGGWAAKAISRPCLTDVVLVDWQPIKG